MILFLSFTLPGVPGKFAGISKVKRERLGSAGDVPDPAGSALSKRRTRMAVVAQEFDRRSTQLCEWEC